MQNLRIITIPAFSVEDHHFAYCKTCFFCIPLAPFQFPHVLLVFRHWDQTPNVVAQRNCSLKLTLLLLLQSSTSTFLKQNQLTIKEDNQVSNFQYHQLGTKMFDSSVWMYHKVCALYIYITQRSSLSHEVNF